MINKLILIFLFSLFFSSYALETKSKSLEEIQKDGLKLVFMKSFFPTIVVYKYPQEDGNIIYEFYNDYIGGGADIYNSIALIYKKNKMPNEEKRIYELGLKHYENYNLLFNLADIYHKEGNKKKALSYLNRIAKLEEKSKEIELLPTKGYHATAIKSTILGWENESLWVEYDAANDLIDEVKTSSLNKIKKNIKNFSEKEIEKIKNELLEELFKVYSLDVTTPVNRDNINLLIAHIYQSKNKHYFAALAIIRAQSIHESKMLIESYKQNLKLTELESINIKWLSDIYSININKNFSKLIKNKNNVSTEIRKKDLEHELLLIMMSINSLYRTNIVFENDVEKFVFQLKKNFNIRIPCEPKELKYYSIIYKNNCSKEEMDELIDFFWSIFILNFPMIEEKYYSQWPGGLPFQLNLQ